MGTYSHQKVRTNIGEILVPVPNVIVQRDGFYISYNDYDTDIYGCATTALVRGQMEAFYILNGDHRKQYDAIAGDGFGACLEYFKANADMVNLRSDKLPDSDLEEKDYPICGGPGAR